MRTPTISIPHGGGPWPLLSLDGFPEDERLPLAQAMRSMGSVAPTPRAAVVISAHWEEPAFTVNVGARPPMLYDYGGFPPESYTLRWPAPGDPALAARVAALIEGAGLPAAQDAVRGFDHGVFLPMMLAFPAATLPTVQLSLRRGLDPAEHLALGRALAPLRDEGVLIVGSGESFHNMGAFFRREPALAVASVAFDDFLTTTVQASPEERDAALLHWAQAPAARLAHPREEHLLPLLVVAGAAGEDRGRVAFRGTMGGMTIGAHWFGG